MLNVKFEISAPPQISAPPFPSPDKFVINNSSTVSIRLMLLQFYYNLHVQTVSPSNFLLCAPPRINALPRLSAPLKTQI